MNIDINEVKRYLRVKGGGYDGLDETIRRVADKASAELCPKSIINKFAVEWTEEGLRLKGTDIVFGGNLVRKTFDGCDEIYIFAATLTLESELFMKKQAALGAVEGIVSDCVLTTMIESCCDDIDGAIAAREAARGRSVTRRISCGYGDFPLECQKDILDILGAGKILGVKLNENNMMYPNKTVTALMGVKDMSFETVGGGEAMADKCSSCCSCCEFKR